MFNINLRDIVYTYNEKIGRYVVGVINKEGDKVFLFQERRVVSSEGYFKPEIGTTVHFPEDGTEALKFYHRDKNGIHECVIESAFIKKMKTKGVTENDAVKLQNLMTKKASDKIKSERREQEMEDNRDDMFRV